MGDSPRFRLAQSGIFLCLVGTIHLSFPMRHAAIKMKHSSHHPIKTKPAQDEAGG